MVRNHLVLRLILLTSGWEYSLPVQDGSHLGNTPLTAVNSIFRDGSISNLNQDVKIYLCAKFGACNQK